MSLPWTKQQKPLGVEPWVSGATPGIQLEQTGIEGIALAITVTGPNAPTLAQLLQGLKRIIVSVSGTDQVNISAYSLYYYTIAMLGGAVPFMETAGNSRRLLLFLPFSMGGSMHSSDTLLDLRRTPEGLVQSFIRFELDTAGGEITTANSSIAVYPIYYTLGDHTRKIGMVRQLRERTLDGANGEKANIRLDYGSDYDDLNALMLFGITAAGALINVPVSPLTLTISENGTREIFHYNSENFNYVLARQFRPRVGGIAANDLDKSVFYYPFGKDDLTGHGRTIKGLLDASNFNSLLVEFTPRADGTYYLLLDRINLMEPTPGANAKNT